MANELRIERVIVFVEHEIPLAPDLNADVEVFLTELDLGEGSRVLMSDSRWATARETGWLDLMGYLPEQIDIETTREDS